MDLTNIWRFIAFYIGKEKNEHGEIYHKFDVSTLFNLANNK